MTRSQSKREKALTEQSQICLPFYGRADFEYEEQDIDFEFVASQHEEEEENEKE